MSLATRPPITEVLRAADARERAEQQTAPRDATAQIDPSKRQDNENTIRAGAINLLMVRANQLGRDHLTPTDMRRFDIAVGAIMREPAKDEMLDMSAIRRIASQTQELDPAPEVLAAMEAAMKQEG